MGTFQKFLTSEPNLILLNQSFKSIQILRKYHQRHLGKKICLLYTEMDKAELTERKRVDWHD